MSGVSTLSWSKLLESKAGADVRFIVGDEKKEFSAHKLLLCLASPIFDALLNGGSLPAAASAAAARKAPAPTPAPIASASGAAAPASKLDEKTAAAAAPAPLSPASAELIAETKVTRDSSPITITLRRMNPESVMMMLRAIYTGLTTAEWSAPILIDCTRLADAFQIGSLHTVMESFVKSGFRPLSWVDSVSLFNKLPLNSKEKDGALQFFGSRMNQLAGSPEFDTLSPATVKLIVSSQFLTVKELTLFRAVVRWSTAECKRNNQSVNADTQRVVLAEILPAIRFGLLTMNELIEHVQPSGLLLPAQLIELFQYIATRGSTHEQSMKIAKSFTFSAEPRTDARVHASDDDGGGGGNDDDDEAGGSFGNLFDPNARALRGVRFPELAVGDAKFESAAATAASTEVAQLRAQVKQLQDTACANCGKKPSAIAAAKKSKEEEEEDISISLFD